MSTMIRIEIDRRLAIAGLLAALIAYPGYLIASSVTIPHAFQDGQVASASQVNANFAAVETAVNDNDADIGALQPVALTTAEHDTLTLGGCADALHSHSGSGLTPMKLREESCKDRPQDGPLGLPRPLTWIDGEPRTVRSSQIRARDNPALVISFRLPTDSGRLTLCDTR